MAVTVKILILRDIQLRKGGHIFTKKCSAIEYDAKRPVNKKLHQLVHQQGEHYGTVGDCCEYLTHAELMRLAATGYIEIGGKSKPRRKKPSLAEILYEAYRGDSRMQVHWKGLSPALQKAWEQVADAAQEWAYENIQWEE